jgi:hypothetical protein
MKVAWGRGSPHLNLVDRAYLLYSQSLLTAILSVLVLTVLVLTDRQTKVPIFIYYQSQLACNKP